MQTDRYDPLQEICGLLARGRRSIHRSKASANVSRALASTLTILSLVTLLSLGFEGARWAGAGVGSRVAGWVLAIGGIVAAVFLITHIIWAYCTIQPNFTQTAERLDLSIGSLNQIATTYELIIGGASSSFAHQQIQVGLGLLRASCYSTPATPAVDWKWPANLARILVILTGIGMIEMLQVPVGPGQSHRVQNGVSTGPIGTTIQADSERRLQLPSKNAVRSTVDQAIPTFASVDNSLAENSQSALANPSFASTIATTGAAESASSKADLTSLSNSMNSNLQSQQSQQSNSKPAPGEKSAGASATGESANSHTTKQNSDVQNGVSADGSSHGSGTKSESPSSPTSSDFGNPKRETALSNTPQNGETDSASTGSKSRREGQAVSSNQASSTSHPDQPSHGRGDASSQSKKSRGVGSLMLGTAVPDLVLGKLSPGTSTMSRREIPPDPSNSQSTLPVDTSAHGSTVESQITRFDLLPSDSGDLASQYLIQLHSSDSAAESKTDSATGSAAPSQPSGVISH